jgi:plastocyanin
MRRIFILKRSSIILAMSLVMLVLGGGGYLYQHRGSIPVFEAKGDNHKEFTIITTEFKSKTDDGKVLEVYRFDPGTIVVKQGDQVTLKFIGVQGNLHPYEIKGLGVKGEIKKGRESTVTFVAQKKGMFPIICQIHTELANNGPMIGYLIVD